MFRFRLRTTTMAIYFPRGAPRKAITIPAGSEILSARPLKARAGMDRSTFVTVEWDGKTVRMFLVDLLKRGKQVDGVDET